MDIHEILENGLIEGYVLGLLAPEETALVEKSISLYPQLRTEIQAVEDALQTYLMLDNSRLIKNKLDEKLQFIEKEKQKLEKGEFNFINKNSDASLWLEKVKPLLPENQPDPFFISTLRDDNQGELFLIKTFQHVENEVHENEVESFMVLEGTCTCYVGDRVYNLTAGDYLEIPLYTNHDVRISSPYVIAIMQRLKLDAA